METKQNNEPWTTSGLDPSRPYLGVSDHCSCGGWFSPSKVVVTNVLYADGSVRGLSDTVSPQVLDALATVAGGEKVGRMGDE